MVDWQEISGEAETVLERMFWDQIEKQYMLCMADVGGNAMENYKATLGRMMQKHDAFVDATVKILHRTSDEDFGGYSGEAEEYK